MKLRIPNNKEKNEKLLFNNIINSLKSKNTKYDIDFFHNKLLNNIIEINNYNNNLILLNNNKKKYKDDHYKFKSSIRKINSAIIRNLKSQKNIFNYDNNSSRAIKRNNIFIKNKKRIDSHFSISNETFNMLRNKTINEESGLLKSSLYNFPYNINSTNKKKGEIFSRENASQIKEDEKCCKINKYVNILEKKMKEKLMRITNFDDVNCCYRRIKINNNCTSSIPNAMNMPNKIFLDVNKIYKLNKCIKNDEQKNDICTSKANNKNQNQSIKNNSISKTSSSNVESLSKNIYKLSQCIKEEVKKYFIKNKYSSIKDYFNDWIFYKRKNDYKNGLFLDCDNIYNYLKIKIGLTISKDDICKIFGCDKAYLDIDNFKNFFFEENSGKKCFIITKDCLLKNTKLDFDNKSNKDNFSMSPSSSNFAKNKENDFSFKYDLFFNILKEQRSLILDKICDYRLGYNKIEYEYSDFNNLINSLKIDKRIYNQKIIKTIFSKYQNKNKKLNIKYFVNILYRNESTRKDYSFDNKKLNKKMKNRAKNIYDKYKFDRNCKNSTTKKTFKIYNVNSPTNECNDKKYFSQNINIIQINNNKYTEESSDYNVIKSKKRYMMKKIEKNKKHKKKSYSPKYKLKIKLNHSAGSEQFNKRDEYSEPKLIKNLKKNINNIIDKSNNSMSSLFNSNREDLNKVKEKTIKKIKNYIDKNKKEKTRKYSNSFKTLRLNSKYKLNKENDKDIINDKNSNKKKQYRDYRPLSSHINRKQSLNNNKDFFNIMNFKMTKIFEEPRIQYLNSDIIDLI